MNEEQKEKYNNFLNMVCEVLGVNKPVDVLKVCAISDEYITPLQNQIKQLGERCLQLQKDKGNLIDRCRELEQQIEKMQNCRNCKNEKIEGACGHFTQVGWCKNWELTE